MVTRWEVIDDVAERLRAAGVPSPDVDAERIVEHIEERFGGDLAGCDSHVLNALVSRRSAREPLQLVLGRTWFRHLELMCAPGVFVPRPETEIVAGLAIDAARAAGDAPTVVDLCTGTGAIALAVAGEVAGAQVTAVDLDDSAVELARANLRVLADAPPAPADRPGQHLAVGSHVEVVHGDLFEPLPDDLRGRIDVVVSNPPYLPRADEDGWAPEVADHDPRGALVGGPDGHEVVDRILRDAPAWLRPGGTVVVEIDERRGADAMAVAREAGLVGVRIVQDLNGRDRAVVAAAAEESP